VAVALAVKVKTPEITKTSVELLIAVNLFLVAIFDVT
jgi:hypothetical protein